MVGCGVATGSGESVVHRKNTFGRVDVIVRGIGQVSEGRVLGAYTDGAVQNILVAASVESRVRRCS